MSKENRKTQDELLIEVMNSKEYAVDQYENVYVKLETKNSIQKIVPVEEEEFQNKLVLFFGNKHKTLLSEQKAKSAKTYAKAHGRDCGKSIHSAQRFATIEDVDYIDMSDKEGNVIKVTESGVEITQNTPVVFRHQKTKLPIKISDGGGDPKAFLKYAHCRDDEQEMLLLVDLILSCKSGIDQPPTCFIGSQGSGKTETAKFFRKVFDPTLTEKEDTLNSKEQLALLVDSNAIIFLDNIVQLKAGIAEQIKKIVTGCTLQKRQLYKDSNMLQYYLHNKFLITSIEVPCRDADFLDRAVIFEFDRFTKEQNKPKILLEKEYEDDVPFIRSGCLETLAKAKRIYSTLVFKDSSRMADYETWGAAVAVALGYDQQTYINAFRSNQSQYRNECYRKPIDPLVSIILDHINDTGTYDGLVSELFEQIKNKFSAEDLKYKKLPTSSVSFGKALSRIEADLEEVEIRMIRNKDRKAGSKIRIEKITHDDSETQVNGKDIINYETGEVYLCAECVSNAESDESMNKKADTVLIESNDTEEEDSRYNYLCQGCEEFTLHSDVFENDNPFCILGKEEPRLINYEYYCPDYFPIKKESPVFKSLITDNVFE